jgi:hypothetical protein
MGQIAAENGEQFFTRVKRGRILIFLPSEIKI